MLVGFADFPDEHIDIIVKFLQTEYGYNKVLLIVPQHFLREICLYLQNIYIPCQQQNMFKVSKIT